MLSEVSGKRCIKRTDNGAWRMGTTPHQGKLTSSKRQRYKEGKDKGKEKGKSRSKDKPKEEEHQTRRV